MWFQSSVGGRTVTLKRLELRDADKPGDVHAKMEMCTQAFKPTGSGGYTAYFSLSKLNLKYIDYVLSVQLIVDKGKGTESTDIELRFEQDYKEYVSNMFWDAYGSV